MGYLDVLGRALNGSPAALKSGNGEHHLVEAVLHWLATGGLAELSQGFGQAGLGGVLASWIGTGANQPVDGDALAGALGASRLEALAKEAGLEPRAAAGRLAALLPDLVDRLSPDGVLPQGGALEQGLGALLKRF